MQDTEIIQTVKTGDTEAFALLVEKYHRPLLAFIFHLVRNQTLTEDIGQDVFLNVYKSLGDFDEKIGTPFAAWLYICARNQVRSTLRKQKHHQATIEFQVEDLTDEQPSALQLLLADEEQQALEYSLQNLEEPFRTTMIRSIEGHPLHVIAADASISVGTVKSRLFRARTRLRALINDFFGG